ncbi:MAG: DUF1549 and DUF1553 domain-containing protein [Planctomycetaceae bacterium]|nr:DUF1549 and DUF1553 domain-containing protein [Planctomycetaceae bacterium]
MRPTLPQALATLVVLACAVQAERAVAADPAKPPEEIHWAFRKPTRPTPPDRKSLKPTARVRNPIDQFVLQQLGEAGLEAAGEASRRTLVRRAYFDLIGLPPSPDQVAAFLDDKSAGAWSRLIDTLLDSKHYGERWGRHWLDVARYADSGGYETDIYYRNAWRYRDYVVNSFNDDKPYHTFVQEQIAGDELWPDNLDLDPRRVYIVPAKKRRHLEARVGTGFFSLGPRVHESGLDARRLAYETTIDWVNTTASAFMGLTLGCARCHEHKFDPFTQADYFALHAIFASAREVELPLWTAMEEADWRQAYPKVVAVQEATKTYRQFEARTKGKPLTPEQSARKQTLLTAVAESVLKLPERAAGQAAVDYVGLMHIPTASVLGRQHPALIRPVHLLERGELNKPLQRISPALPASLAQATGTPAALPQPFGSRAQFALWLTRPDHPLTARVMVNRIWQWHFGRGIVETPNDLGKMGQLPSHPGLLDWLATGFVADGWKVKNLHRLIMNSATYRQTSRFATAKHLAEDPDNRLLWRSSRRRLEAEALWDAVHVSAGTLNPAMGGPPVVPPLAADEIASLREKWHWVVSADPAQHTRRGLYILVRRNFKFPMFDVFDTPVTSVSCPTRDVTTVAPQALWGLNNKSVFRQAMHLAGRVTKEAGADSKARVERLWQITLGRPPRAEESASALKLLEALEQTKAGPLDGSPPALAALPPAKGHALSKLCLAVFNLTEFAFAD